MSIPKPVILKVEDNFDGLNYLKYKKDFTDDADNTILFSYPTVYLHDWKERGYYEVYIGESNDIIRRTAEHQQKRELTDSWQAKSKNKNPNLYVIAHEHFNKSLTLDIEDRLIQYMLSIDKVKKVHNERGNPQTMYYPSEELDEIFHAIWGELVNDNPELFPDEQTIKDSAIFKASPLHKLTDDQLKARAAIIDKVVQALKKDEKHQIIFVEGAAGTGKTVLNSSTFCELYRLEEDKESELHKLLTKKLRAYLLVNHDEQVAVYDQIAQKLGIQLDKDKPVNKPTGFIDEHSVDDPVDVVFIDEAHLLFTQGHLAYKGKNQLEDIIARSKVTVIMYDENQVIRADQYWEPQQIDKYRKEAQLNGNYYALDKQLRMHASPKVINWVDSFTKERELLNIPEDADYEIKIMDSPVELENAIKAKAVHTKTKLSRMVATYDWKYLAGKSCEADTSGLWQVKIGGWHKPWNYELKKTLTRKEKQANNNLAWAERDYTINEIGSTYTIQGFDLSYAGVILGPSVKYRNGKIISDPKSTANDKVVINRTLSDGSKKKFADDFLKHELRILMTRGVNGLYIYACDDELREALKKAANGEL